MPGGVGVRRGQCSEGQFTHNCAAAVQALHQKGPVLHPPEPVSLPTALPARSLPHRGAPPASTAGAEGRTLLGNGSRESMQWMPAGMASCCSQVIRAHDSSALATLDPHPWYCSAAKPAPGAQLGRPIYPTSFTCNPLPSPPRTVPAVATGREALDAPGGRGVGRARTACCASQDHCLPARPAGLHPASWASWPPGWHAPLPARGAWPTAAPQLL